MLDKTLLVEGQLRPMLQDDGVADLVKQASCAAAAWVISVACRGGSSGLCVPLAVVVVAASLGACRLRKRHCPPASEFSYQCTRTCVLRQVAHLGDVSSKYRACPATSPEGQAATASALVSRPWW